MSNIKNKSKGFTLIELLVVISILGVLTTIVYANFNAARKRSRDTARKSDLKQYQTSLENFAASSNLYPSQTSAVDASSTLCTALNLSSCSTDPLQDTQPAFMYSYVSNGSGAGSINATKYVLWAQLESEEAYWVNCSNGLTGSVDKTGWANPSGGNCPI